MGNNYFRMDEHPRFGNRKPDLDPKQTPFIRKISKEEENKIKGEGYEYKVCEILKKAFPEDIILHNIYYETGRYDYELKVYQSYQIDIILVSTSGLFCIECKWTDNKNIRLKGTIKSKKWGKNLTNGLNQNYYHGKMLEELLEVEGFDCPVYRITVIGNISPKNIEEVEMRYGDNLAFDDDLLLIINYIKDNSYNRIDQQKAIRILKEWECKDPDIDISHIFYVRNKKKKKNNVIPKSIKQIMRTNYDFYK